MAIDISKVLNPGLNMFIVSQEEDLQSLTNDVRRIHQEYCADYDRQSNPRMVGVFYQIFTPAFVRNTGLLCCATQSEFFPVDKSFRLVFRDSSEALKQLFLRL